MVSFANLCHFSQTIVDSASEVVSVGLSRTQFILMTLSDFCGSLRQFRFEAIPHALLIVTMFLREQSEGFFGTQLCYAGEVHYSKAIQNLSAPQFPRTATQRALDGVIYFAALPHV
jgi:hypothetical protein